MPFLFLHPFSLGVNLLREGSASPAAVFSVKSNVSWKKSFNILGSKKSQKLLYSSNGRKP